MHWPPRNDLLLAAWLLISVSVHAHIGLVGQTKQFKFLRYIFFIEGIAFVGLAVLLHKLGGMTVMLLASIACTLAFSFPYGLRRTHDYFRLSWRELAEWHRAPLYLAVWLLPVAAIVAWMTVELTPAGRLVIRGGIVGVLAAWMFLRCGLGKALQVEVARRLPAWMRPLLARLRVIELAR
jgi:hypothetical protein